MLKSYFQKSLIEAGCDEAGRGCLAGPVFAAAVILPRNFKHPVLNDSKLLTAVQREMLREVIEKKALTYAIARVDNPEIDKINILKASFKAMHLAIQQLSIQPELLLIDGNQFARYPQIPHQCIVKGDGKYAAIAAASILAKTYRDAYMQGLHKQFPQYNWDTNKGYATLYHREAIKKYGITAYHRRSFTLFSTQLDLF